MQDARFTTKLERITIDSSNATVGMYVTKLDRPWLETPFVFQGFEIRDGEEIDLLQRYCQTITVDVYRGSLSPTQIRSLQAAHGPSTKVTDKSAKKRKEPGKLRRWLVNVLLRLGLKGRKKRASKLSEDGYAITSTVRGEAKSAYRAYVRLCRKYEQAALSAAQHGKISRQALDKAVVQVIESILRNPDAMAWTVFSRRQIAQSTTRAVGTAVWCAMLGRQLSFDRQQLHELAVGGLLLDMGMVRLPAELREHEGKIPDEQFSQLMQHVEFGLDILRRSDGFNRSVLDMVAHHHERTDGSGYPAGLKGKAIPAFARIAGIADTFDAMTSSNAYSPAYAAFDVGRTLNEMSGKQFDAEVVEQFLQTVGMFPTGSVVELNNGQIGLVIEQNRNQALRPKVMVLLDRAHCPLESPNIVELRDLPPDATHANAVWIIKGHEHGAFGIDPMNYFKPRID